MQQDLSRGQWDWKHKAQYPLSVVFKKVGTAELHFVIYHHKTNITILYVAGCM